MTDYIPKYVRYIYHISDIHICEKNFVNIESSFRILLNSIRTPTESLLVIVGDVFENKTYLTTDEIYIFKNIIDSISRKGIYTIIIPGNHDYNINSKCLKNNISLLIDSTSSSFIKCISKTQIFRIANIDFYVFSPIDKKIPSPQSSSAQCRIALLHEPVNGGKYDSGQIIAGSRFSVRDLQNKFDIVMLGDIHKPQFFTPHMAYSGSFVQKNKGEGVDHGYIFWDIASRKGELVIIPLTEIYLKIIARDNNCSFPAVRPNQKIRYVSLYYSNCGQEYINNLSRDIFQKFGILNKVVSFDNESVGGAAPNSASIPDASVSASNASVPALDKTSYCMENHTEIIRNIFRSIVGVADANALSQDQIQLENKILNLHNKYLREVNVGVATKYKLNYMYWNNIMCYGLDNYINFQSFKSEIVLINGKNKQGKSSIIDILIIILFNECNRGYKEDILNKNSLWGNIKLCLNIGRDEYIIEQAFHKSTLQSKDIRSHKLLKNGENITRHSLPETYKYLDKIGVGNYNNFIHITTALQNRNFLIDLPNKILQKLFSQALGIEILYQIEDKIKTEINYIKRSNREICKEFESLTSKKISKEENEPRNSCHMNIQKVEELYNKIQKQIENQENDINKLEPILHSYYKQYDSKIIISESAEGPIENSAEIINEEKVASMKEFIKKYNDSLSNFREVPNKSHEIYLQNCAEEKLLLKEIKSKCADKLSKDFPSISSIDNLLSIYNTTSADTAAATTASTSAATTTATTASTSADTAAATTASTSADTSTATTASTATATTASAATSTESSDLDPNPQYISLYKCIISKQFYENNKNIIFKDFDKRTKTLKPISKLISQLSEKIDIIKKKITQPESELELIYPPQELSREELEKISKSSTLTDTELLQKIYPCEIDELQPIPNIFDVDVDSGADSGADLDAAESFHELDESIIKSKITECQDILSAPVPDYKMIQIYKKKIEKHIHNYKQMKFNSKCSDCNYNKQIIEDITIQSLPRAKLGGDPHEILRRLVEILDNREVLRQKRNQARDILRRIDKYKWTISQNKIFRENKKIQYILNCRIDRRTLRNQSLWKKYNRINHKLQILYFKYNILAGEYNIRQQSIRESQEKYKLITRYKKVYLSSFREHKYWENVDLKTRLVKYKKKILSYENNIKLNNLINNLKKDIELKKTKITASRVKQQELQNILIQLKTRKQRIKDLKQKSCDILDSLYMLELYHKCINHKTGAPSYIMKKAARIISNSCNMILSRIADFTLDIEYCKEFKFYSVEQGRTRIPASMGSGYQKFIVDIVLRIALSRVSELSTPEILFIDEGFGCLDSDNFVNVCNILQTLRTQFYSIFIITHIDELKTYSNSVININKIQQAATAAAGIDFKSIVRAGNSLTDSDKELYLTRESVLDTAARNKFIGADSRTSPTSSQPSERDIELFIQSHGGLRNILLSEDNNEGSSNGPSDHFTCLACRRDIKNRANAKERHINAAKYKKTHYKFIIKKMT
jgi:DNA repair exonuclease SbcCD ATPase subunit